MPVYMDITGFTIAAVGVVISSFKCSIRYLPRNIVPRLDTLLEKTQESLRRAEEVGAIPLQSEYKVRLDRAATELAAMSRESGNARGMFNQLHVASRQGLIRRLYSLSHQIEAIKAQLQAEMDNHRLNNVEFEVIDSTEVPGPVARERRSSRYTATPVNHYISGSAEPTLPLPELTFPPELELALPLPVTTPTS